MVIYQFNLILKAGVVSEIKDKQTDFATGNGPNTDCPLIPIHKHTAARLGSLRAAALALQSQ